MIRQRDDVYDNVFKPISYRHSHRLSKRSLSAECRETLNELQKAAKHAQSFSRVKIQEIPKTLQIMSPIISGIRIPTDDFCEIEDVSPSSSENTIFEEGPANHAKDITKTPMVLFSS